jgi:hypothetical protein
MTGAIAQDEVTAQAQQQQSLHQHSHNTALAPGTSNIHVTCQSYKGHHYQLNPLFKASATTKAAAGLLAQFNLKDPLEISKGLERQ